MMVLLSAHPRWCPNCGRPLPPRFSGVCGGRDYECPPESCEMVCRVVDAGKFVAIAGDIAVESEETK